jgi:hypothetical protein
MAQEPQKTKQINIKIKDDDLKGKYSNLMQITHAKEEFVMDFFLNLPPEGIMVSRVLVSPGHAKRIMGALQENIKRYEEKFGKIAAAEDPDAALGFVK